MNAPRLTARNTAIVLAMAVAGFYTTAWLLARFGN